MSQEQVAQIVFKEAKKSGYVVEQHKSVSTSSVYYTIRNGKSSLHFRVSDHPTNKNVVTLRLDRKTTPKNVENFVKNRIKDLGYRVVLGL